MDGALYKTSPFQIVVVSGVSGAGRSVALRALEDIGYHCVDNLPSSLWESTIEEFNQDIDAPRRVAFGLSIRDPKFIDQFQSLKEKLARYGQADVVFLVASQDVVVDRYSATRRKHPLFEMGSDLVSAIGKELDLVQELEGSADVTFDTSEWSPHQLMRVMEQRYISDESRRFLYLSIFSFGFKHGAPWPADTLFDVRFLKNPYFEPSLKHRTGLEIDVSDYVFTDQRAGAFFEKCIDMLSFLLPQYYDEGKNNFRLAIGCTGGKHRSVAMAEKIAAHFKNKPLPFLKTQLFHRDVEKRSIK